LASRKEKAARWTPSAGKEHAWKRVEPVAYIRQDESKEPLKIPGWRLPPSFLKKKVTLSIRRTNLQRLSKKTISKGWGFFLMDRTNQAGSDVGALPNRGTR